MIDKQRLEEKCSTWNIALTGTQLDQLDAFAQILVDYNQKVNLTAITDLSRASSVRPVRAAYSKSSGIRVFSWRATSRIMRSCRAM